MTPLEEVHDGPRWWAVAVIWCLVIALSPAVLIFGLVAWWQEKRKPYDL